MGDGRERRGGAGSNTSRARRHGLLTTSKNIYNPPLHAPPRASPQRHKNKKLGD